MEELELAVSQDSEEEGKKKKETPQVPDASKAKRVLTPGAKPKAGPSTSKAGPSTSKAGPSTSKAGSSTSKAGPSTSKAGPVTSKAGPKPKPSAVQVRKISFVK